MHIMHTDIINIVINRSVYGIVEKISPNILMR